MKRETFGRIVSTALAAVTLMSGSMTNAVSVQAVTDSEVSSQSNQTVSLQNHSYVESESISLGGQVVMTGSASGGSGEYTYAYYYKKESDANWGGLNYSAQTSASFKPTKETTYNVCIKVKDSNGKVAEKRFNIEVKNTLENHSSISSESITLGSEVIMNGSATGGSGSYTYAYYYKKESDSSWGGFNYSTQTAASFKPTKETTYNVCIRVKDSNGIVAEKRFDVEVKNTFKNTSSVESESISLGSEIIMNGSATGGSGSYTYAYYYKKDADEKWLTVKNYSTDTSASLKPLSETTYNVCIKVKDSNGIVTDKRFNVEVKNTLKNQSNVKSESIALGSEIVMNGAATGGSGTYTYAYFYKRAGDEKWAVAQNYSTNASCSFKPLKETTYNICIKVKDSTNTVAVRYFDVEVVNTLKNTSSVTSESIVLGTNIVMNGAATGGSGSYTYAYLYRRAGDEKWVVAQNYSTDTTCSLKPLKETTYEICIKVKDSSQAIVEKTFNIEVKNTLENQSSVPSESIALGNEIVMNGAATGGSGEYTYAYYYKKSDSDKWLTIKNFSADTSAALKPTAETIYNICIKVKDSNGIVAENKLFNVDVKNTLENLSSVPSESIALGNEIVMNGAATGGSGKYTYAYYYKKSDSDKWLTIKNFSADTSAALKPTAETIYNICIKVKDSNSIVAENKLFNVDVKNTLENLSSVPSEGIALGNEIVMNGAATGGSGKYTYAYLYKRADNANWIVAQDYTTDTSFKFKPLAETTYHICIKVKDSNNIIAEKTFNVEVKNTLINDSYVDSQTISKGQSIVMHGAAGGGSDSYTYAYYYKKETDSEWSTAKGYSDETTVSIKPNTQTIYHICIKVKDSNDIVVDRRFSVTVASSLTNTSSVNNYNIPKGGTLTIRTAASGGSGQYTYKYIYKNVNATEWKTIRDFSTTSSAAVKLSYEGTYEVWAIVRDSNGAELGRYFEIQVKALKNTSKVSSATIDRGKSVTLKASANGGSGNYRYAYQYKKPNSNSWILLKNYSTSMNQTLKMTELGTYIVCIMVRDSSGTVIKRNFNVRSVKPVSEEFIETVIPDIINNSMDEFAKVKAIHDWLVNNFEYDIDGYNSGNIPDTSHTAEGAYQTRKAVCDGYAKSFALLAKYVGLEIKTIIGTAVNHEGAEPETHAWNQVKVNGNWYNIDVTWDDPVVVGGNTDDNLSYQYFLVPDSVIASNHFPQTKTAVCTAPQPWNKIEPAVIEDVKKEESNNVYYCEKLTDIDQAFTKSIANHTKKFTIIYKTSETNYDKVLKTVLSRRPSNVTASGSIGTWKIDGYYRINITILN